MIKICSLKTRFWIWNSTQIKINNLIKNRILLIPTIKNLREKIRKDRKVQKCKIKQTNLIRKGKIRFMNIINNKKMRSKILKWKYKMI
jgi:hypothetical protein